MEAALSGDGGDATRRTVKGQGRGWNLNGIFGISTKNLTIHLRNADGGRVNAQFRNYDGTKCRFLKDMCAK